MFFKILIIFPLHHLKLNSLLISQKILMRKPLSPHFYPMSRSLTTLRLSLTLSLTSLQLLPLLIHRCYHHNPRSCGSSPVLLTNTLKPPSWIRVQITTSLPSLFCGALSLALIIESRFIGHANPVPLTVSVDDKRY